jgi:hypothetical protein
MSARWCVGVDLGQSHDPSAAIVIDRQRQLLDIVYASRLPLNLSYEAQLDRIQSVIDRLGTIHGNTELSGGAMVAFDSTGLGRPVTELAAKQFRCPVIGITITGGRTANTQFTRWTAPKVDLVDTTTVALQQHRLHASPQLSDLDQLLDELKGYSYDQAATGTTFGNDSRTGHDDLVVALLLAVYLASRIPYYPPGSVGHTAAAGARVVPYRDEPRPATHYGPVGERVFAYPGDDGYKFVAQGNPPRLVRVRRNYPYRPPIRPSKDWTS